MEVVALGLLDFADNVGLSCVVGSVAVVLGLGLLVEALVGVLTVAPETCDCIVDWSCTGRGAIGVLSRVRVMPISEFGEHSLLTSTYGK
jgi:hypothetical protein